jgi:hypothetical protein
MIASLRSVFEPLADPLQRRWTLGRLFGRWPAAERFTAHRPPYLDVLPAADSPGSVEFALLSAQPAPSPRLLDLPGRTLRLDADTADQAVDRQLPDEAAAAFHSFAWLAQDADGSLLATVWPAWRNRFATPNGRSPAWQGAVPAERAVAIVDFARRHGLPAPLDATIGLLAAHAAFIARTLAYHGERGTGSLLAHQGRALYRLGVDLDMPQTARLGLALLDGEARRLILPSGVSRDESTHHHLLLARSYLDAWLAARRGCRPEADRLKEVAGRLLAVVPALHLPGGLPLMGDVAETLPAGWLDGLLPGADLGVGWTGRWPASEQAALGELRDSCRLTDLEALRPDGWLRLDLNGWSGLWHAPAGGWLSAAGHGHQDLGACQLHHAGTPILVDPGGSPLGQTNGDRICRLAGVHGGLQLDDHAPLATDRSCFSDAFRRQHGASPPDLRSECDGVSLTFAGFAGVGGPRQVRRYWRLAADGLAIDDHVLGTGRFVLTRRLITPLLVAGKASDGLLLDGGGRRFRLSADAPLAVGRGLQWRGFGQAHEVRFIEIKARVDLPWRGSVRLALV